MIRYIYRRLLRRFKPYVYMRKVGVNFTGGSPLWKGFMEYRTMADNIRP